MNIPDSNAMVELYIFDTAGQSVFNQRDLGTRHVGFIIVLMHGLMLVLVGERVNGYCGL